LPSKKSGRVGRPRPSRSRTPKRRRSRRRFRQYHIIIPTHYNDGTPVEADVLRVTDAEIVGICKGYTRVHGEGEWVTSSVEGNRNFWVDVPDTKATATFFRVYKLVLKVRFKQEEIYMTSRPVTYVPTFRFD